MLQIVTTVVRHALTMLAGGLIADGTLSDVDAQAISQAISGAVLTVAVIAWSIIEKKIFTEK